MKSICTIKWTLYYRYSDVFFFVTFSTRFLNSNNFEQTFSIAKQSMSVCHGGKLVHH